MMRAVLLLALVGAAAASCPNDCSGNGECNIYSACECYRNWMGADCSERVCYFGVAFVDTPQGDLNSDGFMSGDSVPTRFSNKPTWEIYPTYAGWGSVNYQWGGYSSGGEFKTIGAVAGGSGGEAHFYKECSAKGSCDRSSGLCECFDGYEGAGCTRAACNSDCSGHGACRTINEVAGVDPGSESALKYSAWDADVSQVCLCDDGYFGADCSLRMCPKGDDPVTKYEGYTKITFKRTTATTNHDLATYGSGSAVAAGGSTNNNYHRYSDAFGFTPRIWAHPWDDGETGLVTNGLAWSPWYCADDSIAPNSGSSCEYADSYECETKGVSYAATALSAFTAFKHDLVVVGDQSGARGVQRRVPLGSTDPNDSSAAVYGPGCCTGTGSTTDCSDCDFFSLYLTEVEGEFQMGDKIRISWDHATTPGAETIHNYIESISTYYNTGRVQKNEEQVLKITFPDARTSAVKTDQSDSGDAGRFKGYFSLTYTDDFGDEYTTEAISVSVAAACNPSRFVTNGLGVCSVAGANGVDDDTAFGIDETTCLARTGTPTWTAWTTGCGQDAADAATSLPASGTDVYDESLHGDFVIHAQTHVADRSASLFYAASKMEAAPQDFTGGNLVAAKIEEALEALPNGVTGDVKVDYAYNGYVVGTTDLATLTCDATDGNYANCGEGALTRNFVIRFMESSGDLPALKVNYAFSVGGKIYSNQGCGAAKTLTSVVITAQGTQTGTPTYAFANVVCDEDPILTVTLGTGILAVTIDYAGKNCVVGSSAATLAIGGSSGSGGTVTPFFTSDSAGDVIDCITGAKGESLSVSKMGDTTAKAEIMERTTETTVTDGTDTATFDSAGNAHGNDPYDSSAIWARHGVAKTLGVKGSTENVECSNRGTCDYTTGECMCFTGFSSKDCSTQNSLATGSAAAAPAAAAAAY